MDRKGETATFLVHLHILCNVDLGPARSVCYEGGKWRRKGMKAGSNSPVLLSCLTCDHHCGVPLSFGITYPGWLDSFPCGAVGVPHGPSDGEAEEHSTLSWCPNNPYQWVTWTRVGSCSTGKLGKPANQRGKKTELAMRINSREGNNSFKSVLEVCFILSPN